MASHVLIIGGGIGGLCLAHGLKKHNISFHVYERDSAQDYRAQGYRIRVAREGVESLRYLLDDEAWRLFELTCGETKFRPIPEIDATSAKVEVVKDESIPNKPPTGPNMKPYTVDRTMFREILLRRLEDHISWGKAMDRYEITEDGISAIFRDSSAAKGTLLVGADGAHSSVRKQYLPNHQILDTRGRCIYGKTVLTPGLIASLEPDITQGGMLAIKDRSREQFVTTVVEPVVFPNRTEMEAEGFKCPDNYIYWVMSAQAEVLNICEHEALQFTPQQSERLAMEVAQYWHPLVRPLVENQEPGATAVLPINSVSSHIGTWEPNECVTLIGDSVHLMGPTSGSGAITAIRDAELLCRLLQTEGQSKQTIEKYESRMKQYAGEIVHKSWVSAKYIFGQKPGEDRHIGEVMMANRSGKLK